VKLPGQRNLMQSLFAMLTFQSLLQ